MKCVVTGAAGFIGSHLCERLLRDGHDVVGVDAFIPYYAPSAKERNIAGALAATGFRLTRLDLRHDALDDVVRGADVVFHLAAMPGLAQSWTDFDGYLTCNVTATRRLLEALRGGNVRKLVYASTSSVYGKFASGDETLGLRPVSPYGVTKLAAEHLCRSYAEAYGLPLVVLRYFSVYGPRQRPDMAYHRFMRAMLLKEPLTVYGDGQHVRGNTYVDDCVEATVRAANARPGEIYNIGGGEAVSVVEIIRMLEGMAGYPAIIRREAGRYGDQRHTFADTARLQRDLDWHPHTSLADGLARQWDWHKSELAAQPVRRAA
jgi:nucleoside-diphosphate-sugar epimerase